MPAHHIIADVTEVSVGIVLQRGLFHQQDLSDLFLGGFFGVSQVGGDSGGFSRLRASGWGFRRVLWGYCSLGGVRGFGLGGVVVIVRLHHGE